MSNSADTKPANADDTRSQDKTPSFLNPLLDGIKNYHKTNRHWDLLVKCQGREWKVHKAIVCPQSDFFEKVVSEFKVCSPSKADHVDSATTNSVLEGTLLMDEQEAKDGVVELKEDDPQVVDALVHYLYNFDYGDFGNGQQDVDGIVLDVRMFIIADKYFVHPLKQLAAKKFAARCEKHWRSPVFADAAQEVYDAGIDHDDTLKQIVIATVKAHVDFFLASSKKHEFSRLSNVLETTELGADVLRALMSADTRNTYECPSCHIVFTVDVPEACVFGCPKDCRRNSRAAWLPYLVGPESQE